MKYLIISLTLLYFSGCSKQVEKIPENKKSDVIDSPNNKTNNQSGSSAKSKSETNNTSIEKLTFEKNNIPSECSYKGKIVEGARWKDRNGENILLITQTDIHRLNDEVKDQYLYGYLYLKKEDGWNLEWNINDHVDGYCDAEAKYITGTLEVVDIDNDGIAENIFIYKLDERCDVSPLSIKLMMHSSDKKLVIRGNTRVDIGNGEKAGGKKVFDEVFNSSPESFKEYASKKWDNFMKDYKDP